jgi:hypothetical protein
MAELADAADSKSILGSLQQDAAGRTTLHLLNVFGPFDNCPAAR